MAMNLRYSLVSSISSQGKMRPLWIYAMHRRLSATLCSPCSLDSFWFCSRSPPSGTKASCWIQRSSCRLFGILQNSPTTRKILSSPGKKAVHRVVHPLRISLSDPSTVWIENSFTACSERRLLRYVMQISAGH